MTYGVDPPKRRGPLFFGLLTVGCFVASAVVESGLVQLGLLAVAVLAGIGFLRSLTRPPEMHGFGIAETPVKPKRPPVDVGVPDAPAPALAMDAETVLANADPSRKIDAIKDYRAATGAGLKEAKEVVEAYFAQQGRGPGSGPWG